MDIKKKRGKAARRLKDGPGPSEAPTGSASGGERSHEEETVMCDRLITASRAHRCSCEPIGPYRERRGLRVRVPPCEGTEKSRDRKLRHLAPVRLWERRRRRRRRCATFPSTCSTHASVRQQTKAGNFLHTSPADGVCS